MCKLLRYFESGFVVCLEALQTGARSSKGPMRVHTVGLQLAFIVVFEMCQRAHKKCNETRHASRFGGDYVFWKSQKLRIYVSFGDWMHRITHCCIESRILVLFSDL